MKQLWNLHHKRLQLSSTSRISHDDMYNLHEIAYDNYSWIYLGIITFPDLVCAIPAMFLIHECKFANTHKELFKQCVQDVPAIRKAKYPLVIDREQARGWQHTISLYEISWFQLWFRDFNSDFMISTMISDYSDFRFLLSQPSEQHDFSSQLWFHDRFLISIYRFLISI